MGEEDFDWSKVTSVIKGIAPLLGTALGGPAGGAVGTLVAAALGVEETPDQMYEAIKADPDAAIKLRKLELEHKFDLERLVINSNIRNREIDTADIQSARLRDTSTQLRGYHNYRADLLAAFAFISLCTMVYMININIDLKPEVLAIFNMSIGALLKMIGDVFAFEFGSSRGSKEKDK